MQLNHYVVPAGRTFLRRLINLLRDSKRYWKTIRVTREYQLDLEWWSDLLPSWDGVYFFDLVLIRAWSTYHLYWS
jgi:hypothetical protein